jgi:DNA polymerase (family 10)
MTMSKHDVAEALREIGVLLELTGENPFKTRAYENAARHLEGLSEDLAALTAEGRLTDLPGIGESLAKKIAALVTTGKLDYLEDLRQQVPAGLLDLLRIPDIGPKKAAALWKKLNITTVAELEQAAKSGQLRDLAGFGPKTEANILAGIDLVRRAHERTLLGEALPFAEGLAEGLRKCKAVEQVELAGSLRRRRETVKDVDLLAISDRPEAVMDAFARLPEVETVVERGSTKSSARLTNLMNCDLRVLPAESFAAALMYFTGSAEHNIALRGRAKSMGLKISEYGLFEGETNLFPTSEAEIYTRLGLDYIEPELREDTGEIDAAAEHALPNLVADSDMQGIIHAHTVASDGHSTIEEIAQAAKKLGYAYLVICDHSRSATYANGMDVPRLKEHVAAIRAASAKMKGFTILAGAEVDILADGSLDYPDDVLAELDVVVGSVHSRFKMSSAEMTQRIIKALHRPYLHILGHLTGRLLLTRDGYPVDQERVIAAAAETGAILEINAHPQRLDLDWRHCKMARMKGVKLAICPDAHAPDGLADMRYGLMVARRGWCEKDDIVNSLSARELAALCTKITNGKIRKG